MDRLGQLQVGLTLAFGAIVLLLVAGAPVPAILPVGVISASFAVFVIRAHRRKARVAKALWWLLPAALAFGLLASSVSYAEVPCRYVLAPQWYCWWPFDFGGLVFSVWSCMIYFVYVPYPPGCSSGSGYLAIPEGPGL